MQLNSSLYCKCLTPFVLLPLFSASHLIPAITIQKVIEDVK